MVRFFFGKCRLSHLRCVYLCLAVNSLLFMIYPTVTHISKETSTKLGIVHASFPPDRGRVKSILRYFELKRQTMKRSPFKTIVRNTFQKPPNKTSFLIYEYIKHRSFCKKRNSALVYIPTCPFRNCQFTCNASLAHTADAILILYSPKIYKRLFNLNVSRNPNQIWLLWQDEPYSPSSIFNKFLFNWTISYRLDSEVSLAAYGITFVRNEPMNQLAFSNWINENYKKRHNEAGW